ncbi:MAG: Rieske 2Fe-2S domain-containing protein, partial [Vicinamibacterales bacterium]
SPPTPASQYDDLVGWFRQRDSTLWTMGLCVPLGRLSWNQLEAVALLAKRWGDGHLRTTHEQGLAVINIPTGFKDAAATDAAAVGLSIHADSLARNTMACTGTQFCNIGVTETKGTMFRLIDTLRQRMLALHGIRIHMSGCPSSCAQHFTADIGLKGVRVRRLIGAREGFDVYLGGGVAGDVHLGLRYKLGVDVDQLPLVIEELVKEYYLKHRSGQTFSAYWREHLQESEAAQVGEDDYKPSTWVCERCDYHHRGEDPPVFCPGCAGVRRLFARLDDQAAAETLAETASLPVCRDDGFVFAAADGAVHERSGVSVEIEGRTYALFRLRGTVHALDGICPHEGGLIGEGAITNGLVTCPLHGWTFDACTGCSVEPAGNDIGHYETRVEGGNIYMKPTRRN